MLAAHLGIIDEEQINNMSYVFFDDVLRELGYKLNYEAVVNYAGNAFCEKAWDMIDKSNPFNTASYDTGEGRQELYDILATHDMWDDIMGIVDADMVEVDNIIVRLESSAKRNFEHTHSLQFQVLKTLQSLLGTEDVTETIARAESLNSKLIDMLGALQREQASPVKAGGLQLARKPES